MLKPIANTQLSVKGIIHAGICIVLKVICALLKVINMLIDKAPYTKKISPVIIVAFPVISFDSLLSCLIFNHAIWLLSKTIDKCLSRLQLKLAFIHLFMEQAKIVLIKPVRSLFSIIQMSMIISGNSQLIEGKHLK